MQYRLLVKQISILSVLIGIALFPTLLFNNDHTDLSEETLPISSVVADVEEIQEEQKIGFPRYIKIPKLDLVSTVEFVNISEDGSMETPNDIHNVGWYELGVRPGEIGSAVVTGHYGWENGNASAFDNLHKLRIGDRLYVEDDAGILIAFIVRENRRYDPEEDVPEVFGSNDGKAHLNLISCEGDWDEVTKQYSQRLVVFTDRE